MSLQIMWPKSSRTRQSKEFSNGHGMSRNPRSSLPSKDRKRKRRRYGRTIHVLNSGASVSLTVRSALEFDLKRAYRILEEVNRVKAEVERIVEMLRTMEEYMKEKINKISSWLTESPVVGGGGRKMKLRGQHGRWRRFRRIRQKCGPKNAEDKKRRKDSLFP